jgi:hypothetical protein
MEGEAAALSERAQQLPSCQASTSQIAALDVFGFQA